MIRHFKHAMRTGPTNFIADIVFDNMLSATFDRADAWPQLVMLCQPEYLLDSQLRSAKGFLQVHGDRTLSHGQKRLLQLRKCLSRHLSRNCACGCGARMPKRGCSGCKRVFYASIDCQTRWSFWAFKMHETITDTRTSSHWSLHRDICKGVWQRLKNLKPVADEHY